MAAALEKGEPLTRKAVGKESRGGRGGQLRGGSGAYPDPSRA